MDGISKPNLVPTVPRLLHWPRTRRVRNNKPVASHAPIDAIGFYRTQLLLVDECYLVQYAERVGLRQHIQIWQPLAGNVQTDLQARPGY